MKYLGDLVKLLRLNEKMMSWLTTLRAMLFIPWLIFHTLLSAVMVITLCLLTNVDLAMRFIRYFWAYPLLKFLGLEVEVRGLEKFKINAGSILIFNHSSHLDIPIIFAMSPKSIFFGAKIELFKIPFFGAAMRAVGALPIDRRQRSQVLKVYEAAMPRLKKGETFALAPEGTRQSEARIGSFKRGPFDFACQAEALLQPLVISGALRVLPNHTILANTRSWKSKVIVEFLSPIVTHKEDDPSDLIEVARSHMAQKLGELNEELGVS